jgi:hypothetical protein
LSARLRKNIYERQQTAAEILAQLGEARLDLLMRERSGATPDERFAGCWGTSTLAQ